MHEWVHWSEDGSAYNPRFRDRYHSCSGAIAQAACVFLSGCGLPERWRGKDKFTVLETGFGLGLNFLTSWAAWEADPQRCGQLHFYSVEAYLVSAADMVRAASASACEPGLPLVARVQELAQELASAWKTLPPGLHQLRFDQGRVRLTLAIGDAGAMLPALECQADAVFLDGFSPSVNPDMWSRSTLQAVAMHCRPGTRLATYTVARSVRDGLTQLGFCVKKCRGLPPKRNRLEAEWVPPQ